MSGYFLFAKNNRSKSVWTLFQRKLLNNQTAWPVIFGLTGPICARAPKSLHPLELRPRGHHDWPVKPTIRELVARSEFVPQRELHHTRLGKQASVGSEIVRRLGKRSEQRCSYTLGVKAREVRHVKYFPPKLQTVTFPVGHLPALAQTHVQAREAVPTKNVARADLTRKRQGEVRLRCGGIGENVNASPSFESTCSRF